MLIIDGVPVDCVPETLFQAASPRPPESCAQPRLRVNWCGNSGVKLEIRYDNILLYYIIRNTHVYRNNVYIIHVIPIRMCVYSIYHNIYIYHTYHYMHMYYMSIHYAYHTYNLFYPLRPPAPPPPPPRRCRVWRAAPKAQLGSQAMNKGMAVGSDRVDILRLRCTGLTSM